MDRITSRVGRGTCGGLLLLLLVLVGVEVYRYRCREDMREEVHFIYAVRGL